MRKSLLLGSVVLGLVAAVPAVAQQSRDTRSDSGMRMPYESGFWNYAGISLGSTKFDRSCAGGFSCDDTDVGLKLFAGGKVNEAIGVEVGYVNFGKAHFAGGDTEASTVNISAVFGLPIGQEFGLNAKLGLGYGWSKVSAQAAGYPTGKERGWAPSFGIGGTWGFSRNWQVRVDWDRYRIHFAGDKDNVDMLSAGVAYRF